MKSALIHTFFISRHSLLMDWGFLVVSVFWRMFPIAGCNPVGITSRVAPSGSIPSSSTKYCRVTQRQSNRLISDKSTFRNCPWQPNLLCTSKHGVCASLLMRNELGSIPRYTASLFPDCVMVAQQTLTLLA
jgi:hypothetical protein